MLSRDYDLIGMSTGTQRSMSRCSQASTVLIFQRIYRARSFKTAPSLNEHHAFYGLVSTEIKISNGTPSRHPHAQVTLGISRACAHLFFRYVFHAGTNFSNTRPVEFRRPVWYENLSGVVSCPENI